MEERQLAELHCTEASCQAPQGMSPSFTGGISAAVADSHIPGYLLKSILHAQHETSSLISLKQAAEYGCTEKHLRKI